MAKLFKGGAHSHTPTSKTIGGRRFHALYSWSTKASAQADAKSLKTKSKYRFVRVIPETEAYAGKADKVWTVYVSN